jgi:ribosome-associated heat shock protein Hsp15
MHDDDTPAAGGSQRLDKWLWFARVVKSRTLAAGLVADGKVRINRTRAEKPSQTVKAGDVLTIAVHGHVRVLEVAAPGVRRGPATEAATLYRDLTPKPDPDTNEPVSPAERDPGTGRPTKRERRQIERLKGEEG